MANQKSEENGVSIKSKELITDFDPPKPPKRNKYAFACAMLASMTSVLLGYGNLLPHFLADLENPHRGNVSKIGVTKLKKKVNFF
ncbi:hypothetical protein Hanom_Chr12g01119091 [Helianthus anomalus]